MSHAIAFDTLASMRRLREAGFTEQQAETQTRIMAELVEDRFLATKQDLKELELRIAAEIAPLKWSAAVTVAGIVALIIKTFFPH